MTEKNVHLKPQNNGHLCKISAESDSDLEEPKSLVLEGRYAYVLRIIGFIHYVSYSLLCNKLPQSLIVACKHLLFHSFCGSEIWDWLSWLVLVRAFSWGIVFKISVWCIVLWRLDWNLRIYLQGCSSVWLLAGGLSFLQFHPLPALFNMTASSSQSKWSKRKYNFSGGQSDSCILSFPLYSLETRH